MPMCCCLDELQWCVAFSVVQKIYRYVFSHLYFFLLFCFSFPPSYSCFNLFPPFLLLLSYTGGRKRWRGAAFVVTKLVRKSRPFLRHFQGFDHFFPKGSSEIDRFSSWVMWFSWPKKTFSAPKRTWFCLVNLPKTTEYLCYQSFFFRIWYVEKFPTVNEMNTVCLNNPPGAVSAPRRICFTVFNLLTFQSYLGKESAPIVHCWKRKSHLVWRCLVRFQFWCYLFRPQFVFCNRYWSIFFWAMNFTPPPMSKSQIQLRFSNLPAPL